ncbi:uncharacterized protein LOC126908812 [Daktulosphaira vitifoliae]|uniref:uncharacterized protein LOC126908812 n=1 Tax=Daktulosphaira vitifoliae TaxID=58002 RepID=UPI0021A9AEF8|nr:uncharacterized protein LOC126908812 [Daktulosphaira vitifoliae]
MSRAAIPNRRGATTRYCQLYFISSTEATAARIEANRSRANLLESVLRQLDEMLRAIIPYAEAFRNMNEVWVDETRRPPEEAPQRVTMFFIEDRNSDPRRYNASRVNEVAAVFTGENGLPPAQVDFAVYDRATAGPAMRTLSTRSRVYHRSDGIPAALSERRMGMEPTHGTDGRAENDQQATRVHQGVHVLSSGRPLRGQQRRRSRRVQPVTRRRFSVSTAPVRLLRAHGIGAVRILRGAPVGLFRGGLPRSDGSHQRATRRDQGQRRRVPRHPARFAHGRREVHEKTLSRRHGLGADVRQARSVHHFHLQPEVDGDRGQPVRRVDVHRQGRFVFF